MFPFRLSPAVILISLSEIASGNVTPPQWPDDVIMREVTMKQGRLLVRLSCLKLVNRWSFMRNMWTENMSERSLQVTMVAHTLAVIKNREFGGNVNAECIALLTMYYDTSEMFTDDLPTPMRYFSSQIAQEYKAIEKIAQQRLVDMVSEELRDIFTLLIDEHAYSDGKRSLTKQVSALYAYLKYLEKLVAESNESSLAKTQLEATLEARRSQEMDYFMEVSVPSFCLSLDGINQDSPL